MKPLVSVCCITYNHEKYIADALDSFLMQETSFSFEIIVHDDASTDRTAEIIREYELKYPDIIKPIYQTINQHSQGLKIIYDIIIPFTKGKYLAICEGDDFWTSNVKLQKQVDFLENNPQYTMCFHAVKIVDTSGNFKGRYLGSFGKGSKDISIGEAARGGLVHASSRVIRLDFYNNAIPNWIRNAKHGDYAQSLYIATEGKIFYIDDVMSAYRDGVENSMMTKLKDNYSVKNDIEYNKNRIKTLELADEYYEFQYHVEIRKANLTSIIIINILTNNYSKSAIKSYIEYIKYRGFSSFMKIFILKKMPLLALFLTRTKESIGKLLRKGENIE